jgi:hypothetical protein
MKVLFIGGSMDGKRMDLPDDARFRLRPVVTGQDEDRIHYRQEQYDRNFAGSGDVELFVLSSIPRNEAIDLLISHYFPVANERISDAEGVIAKADGIPLEYHRARYEYERKYGRIKEDKV